MVPAGARRGAPVALVFKRLELMVGAGLQGEHRAAVDIDSQSSSSPGFCFVCIL